MAKAYFTTPLSENLEETPEGFLIARDCVVARTGWYKYAVSELPQDKAADFGLDLSKPHAEVEIYRPEEEVFHPDTLASFEGKPVTDGHPEGGAFVDPANFGKLAKGHLQNVRRGKEPLESGDYPMLADVHIESEPLLSKVRNKIVRDLSCGYSYNLGSKGGKLLQKDITGNHVAVVPQGRAGSEARINDAASAASATEPTVKQTKEKRPVKNHLKHLLGLGLKAMATDAEPEELAEAARAVSQHDPEEVEDRGSKVRAQDAKAKDKKAADGNAKDKRAKMHAALDRMLDEEGDYDDDDDDDDDVIVADEEENELTKEDEEKLEEALDDVFEEEVLDPEEEELAEDADDDKDEEEEEEEEEQAEDADDGPEGAGQCTEENGKETVVAKDGRRAVDRARAADGALATLRAMRPVVARSNDQAVRKAFNAALRNVTRRSNASTGSYGKFAAASRARDKAPRRTGRAADSTADANAKLQAFYNDAFKGGK